MQTVLANYPQNEQKEKELLFWKRYHHPIGVWGGVPQYHSRINMQQKCLQHFTDVYKAFLLRWFWRTSHIVIIKKIVKHFTVSLLPYSGSHQRIQQPSRKAEKIQWPCLPTMIFPIVPMLYEYSYTLLPGCLWCDSLAKDSDSRLLTVNLYGNSEPKHFNHWTQYQLPLNTGNILNVKQHCNYIYYRYTIRGLAYTCFLTVWKPPLHLAGVSTMG